MKQNEKQQNVVSELDLLLYILAIEKKYYDLFEMYGMFYEYKTCKHCRHDNQMQFKLTNDIIRTFGETGIIKIPQDKELKQVSRDITIWKGLMRCEDTSLSIRVEEYAARYKVSQDTIYKIRHRVQAMVDKFLAMKKIFKRRKREPNS